MSKYLLPCHDGRTVEVTSADAGRMIDCPCGKLVQVPTLRGSRNLPRAAEAAVAASPAWSPRQGAMFTIGLCLLLVAGVVVGLTYNRWRKIETIKPEVNADFLAQMEKIVADAEPTSTLEAWYALKNNPLPEERQTLPWESSRAEAGRYLILMSVAAALAVIGLGLAIASPFVRPTPATKRKQS